MWSSLRVCLSVDTVRHVLRWLGYTSRTRPRKQFYPANWAWDEQRPFSLRQGDTKDILDRAALGSRRWTHIIRQKQPRYQWTCLEARTRLRVLAYSHELSVTNGIAFLVPVKLHLRSCGIRGRVAWQIDWGGESDGSDRARLQELKEQHYASLGAVLARCPRGRKGYNGRVERSLRAGDEEFYVPSLLDIADDAGLLCTATAWLCYYNFSRPHQGIGMRGLPPYRRLQWRRKKPFPRRIALLPPVLLDTISADMTVNPGNDVLTLYTQGTITQLSSYMSTQDVSGIPFAQQKRHRVLTACALNVPVRMAVWWR